MPLNRQLLSLNLWLVLQLKVLILVMYLVASTQLEQLEVLEEILFKVHSKFNNSHLSSA